MGIILDIQESTIVFSEKKNNTTVTKILDPRDVMVVLGKYSAMNSGLLPRGTRYFARLQDTSTILLDIPPQQRHLTYKINGTEHTGIVPLPGLACMYSVKYEGIFKNLQASFHLFAYKDPVLVKDSVLYQFPFGNVYGDGRVCWGSVNVPNVQTLVETPICVEAFMNGLFNGDLSGNSVLASGDFASTIGIQLLHKLATENAPVYPLQTLKLAQTLDFKLSSLLPGGST